MAKDKAREVQGGITKATLKCLFSALKEMRNYQTVLSKGMTWLIFQVRKVSLATVWMISRRGK